VPIDLDKAQKYLRPPAEAGLAISQFGLGTALAQQGKIKDAALWLQRSAEGGYPSGQFFWAATLFEGQAVERNASEALKWARMAADNESKLVTARAGDAPALVARILLDETLGLSPEPEEAFRRATRSAEQGNPRGQHLLGLCYHRGAGVPRDLASAVKWYRLAAEQKEPTAASTLGTLFESGDGIPRDFTEAVKWYRVGAEAGEGLAQYRLGLCYRDGTAWRLTSPRPRPGSGWQRGSQPTPRCAWLSAMSNANSLPSLPSSSSGRVSKPVRRRRRVQGSWKQAFEHLRKATDYGHPYAPAVLAGMYRRGDDGPGDDAAAEALIGKIERTSDRILLHYIGMSYVGREGISAKHAARAIGFLRRAALLGYPPSQNTLGFRLMSAPDRPSDLVEAFKWLTLAAQQGDPDAQANLTHLRPKLTDEQVEEGTRAAANFQPESE
jgi:TPR repeat protein